MPNFKRRTVRILVALDVVTNMDDVTLIDRIEHFVHPVGLRKHLSEGETITILAKDVSVKEGAV